MEEKYLGERIAEDGITVKFRQIPGRSAGGYLQWTVSLHKPDGSTFSMEETWESNSEPTAFDVLDWLCAQMSIISQVSTRKQWAAEYTMDYEEGRKNFTQEDFDTLKRMNTRFREFLGRKLYRAYLYETDYSK